MSHHSPRFNSGTMGSHWRRGGQQNPPGRFPPAHPTVFHGEIQRLNYLLEMERAGRDQKLSHLEAELEETKLQLKKQKDLKETFINQAKEAKRELERLEKFSDPAVLNAAVTASRVHSDVKYMTKKSLQQDFEALKVAHLLSREAFVAEIQAERKESQTLQEQLDQLQTSFEELSSKHEADDALLRKEAETQKIHEARLHEEQRLLKNLRAEKDQMFQEMSLKITFLQDSKQLLQEELTQLRHSYSELNCRYQNDVSELKQDAERYQEELRQEKHANIKREKENLQLINDLRAEKAELSLNMSKEITIRQKREKQMRHELDQVHLSYEELECRYERDIMDIQQQVETYEEQIKEERKAHLEKTEQDKVSLDKLRAEKEELLQNMSGEITIWQNREKQLLHELDQVQVSHQELKCRFETDTMNLQQEVETYQQQLKDERKDHMEKIEEDKVILDSMKAEKEELLQKMSAEITIRQTMEKQIVHELDQIHIFYQELKCRYKRDLMDIQQDYRQKIEEERKAHLDKTKEDKMLLDNLRAEYAILQENTTTEIKFLQDKERSVQAELEEVNGLEEELSGEPFSGCSTDPGTSEETKISGETVQEDLDQNIRQQIPEDLLVQILEDRKKKKSQISFWKKVQNALRWKKPKKNKTVKNIKNKPKVLDCDI